MRALEHERRHADLDTESTATRSHDPAPRMQFQSGGTLPPVSAERLGELRMAIHKTYKAAYDAEKAAGGGEPARVEAGVIAVCRTFHLIYDWGQGQDLHRVR